MKNWIQKKEKSTDVDKGRENTREKDHIQTHALKKLVHALYQLVDKLLTVTSVTAFVEVVSLLLPTAQRVRQLERPQEVVGLLESRADSVDLMDKVLNAQDVLVAQASRDDLVLRQRDALLVHFTETTLVDEVVDGFQARLAVGYVRLDETQHCHGRVVDLHEGGIVDLTQTKELQDLLGLGRNAHDTADAHDEKNLGHVLYKVVAGVLSLTAGTDKSFFIRAVLIRVFLGTLENFFALSLVGLDLLRPGSGTLSLDLGKRLLLLEE
jgi:hypothetical protein